MAFATLPPVKTDGQLLPASHLNSLRTGLGELQDRHPDYWSQTGAAVGPGTFAAETTLATINVAAPGIPGKLEIDACLFVAKVATDRHLFRVRIDGNVAIQIPLLGLAQHFVSAARSVDVNASAHVITMTLTRDGAGGNAQVYSDVGNSRLEAKFVGNEP